MKLFKTLSLVSAAVLALMTPQAFLSVATASGSSESIMIFAAASTTNAVTEIKDLFQEKKGTKATASFASSSTLAKQIATGAPANVYISANPKWMSYLEDKNLIEPGTACSLLGNRIVLIAPSGSRIKKIDIRQGLDMGPFLGDGFVAMGDPDHVPAGIYGKKAFESLGIWPDIQTRIVRAKDVRSALLFVERNETPLGVVYATDAAISKKIKIVGTFPESSHPQIVYKAGLVAGLATPAAQKFMAFLTSEPAAAIFKKYGFFVRLQ